jgi:TolA-binding protein
VFVELHEGAVEVKGGSLSPPLVVREGQTLEAGTATDDWRITPLSPRNEARSVPTIAASEAPATASAPSDEPAPTTSAMWPTLMSRREFATIVQQAQAMGVERCFANCSPANLRILADAARYTGKFDIAESSLLALRRRSPAQAAAASFFLGRLYESRGRNAEALRTYEQHLAEAPHGDYVEEAMAGRMRMLVGLRDTRNAREAADSYLRQFPNGVHAASARRVLENAGAP